VKFPEDPKIRQKWINAVGNSDWMPSKSAALCEVSTEV